MHSSSLAVRVSYNPNTVSVSGSTDPLPAKHHAALFVVVVAATIVAAAVLAAAARAALTSVVNRNRYRR
jgi:hypothetical protein